jgi:fatty acid desaturase
MDHREFMESLDPAMKAELAIRSDSKGLLHLVGHFGAILATGVAIASQVPLWPLLMPVQGVLIVFLFTLEHEATHKTPFAKERLNEAIGHLCGFLILLPFLWFRYFHLAHHRWTNIDGRDPELEAGKPETGRDWLFHVSGLPYWKSEVRLLWRLVRGREAAAYLPAGALPRMQREARVMLLGYAIAGLSLIWTFALVWIWVLPVLLGQPFLRLYLLAEHGDCPRVANMFENTRTTFTTVAVRFLAWNMPFHVEHHVAPSVPFHGLPDLHRAMKAQLRVTADGYGAFSREYLMRRIAPGETQHRD